MKHTCDGIPDCSDKSDEDAVLCELDLKMQIKISRHKTEYIKMWFVYLKGPKKGISLLNLHIDMLYISFA